MTRKGKVQEFSVEQEVVRTDVKGNSFDLLLKFDNTIDQPQLYMDELVKIILEGLIERYGQIVVKVNWWSSGLMVIAPNEIPAPDQTYNASVASQDGHTGTIDSNPSPISTQEK